MTRGVEGRGVAREKREGGGEGGQEKAIDAYPPNPPHRASRNPRSSGGGRHGGACKSAWRRDALRPSLPLPSPTPDKRVRVYTAYTRSGVPRRGRCAHRVASRVGERVHATRVAEPCFARTLNANHRPTDRKTDWCTRPSLRLVSLPSRRRPYFFPSYFLSPFDSLFLSSIEDRKYFDPRIRFLFRN